MKHFKKAVSLVALCIASGCATTQSTSDAQSERAAEQPASGQSSPEAQRRRFQGIHSVTVGQNVGIADNPVVYGRAYSVGCMFGAIGCMAADRTPESLVFKKTLEDHKIDLKEIVRQEFISNLTAIQAFPAIVMEGGDANFELRIISYGLAPGLSMALTHDRPLKPTLTMWAKLLTRDGKLLWENSEVITAVSDAAPAHKQAIYYANPRLIEEGFRKVASALVKDLLKDLSGK